MDDCAGAVSLSMAKTSTEQLIRQACGRPTRFNHFGRDLGHAHQTHQGGSQVAEIMKNDDLCESSLCAAEDYVVPHRNGALL